MVKNIIIMYNLLLLSRKSNIFELVNSCKLDTIAI